MPVPVLVLVLVLVLVAVALAMIGARLGLEGTTCRCHHEPEATEHAVQNVVPLVEDAARLDVDPRVTVTQMVGRASQGRRVGTNGQGQLLLGGFDPKDSRVFAQEAVAVLERFTPGEQERQGLTVARHDALPALLPGIEVEENDPIRGRRRGGAPGDSWEGGGCYRGLDHG